MDFPPNDPPEGGVPSLVTPIDLDISAPVTPVDLDILSLRSYADYQRGLIDTALAQIKDLYQRVDALEREVALSRQRRPFITP